MLILIGCQKEFIDTREPDKSVTITANDNIAELILKVVLKDGSYDNIIDGCSEISIKFPYSILIEDQEYNINSQEDIDVIMKDHFFERDDIEIVFPITVFYSNYSEETLNNPDELEEIQEQYNTELSDDDIECIDFVFPIEIALYNTARQITDVVTIDNDYDLYSIFNNIDDLVIEISFPIVLELSDGQQISIDDNFQLEEEIDRVLDSCDEDDEYEFDDADYPFVELITGSEWNVSWYSDTTDETSSFSGYTFTFSSDLSVLVNTGTSTVEGAWEVDAHSDSIFLEIAFDTDETPLVWLNHEWMITNANTNEISLEAESDFDGYIKRLNLAKSE
ncbi:MAG: hypothetical protein ABFS32_08620 [Bacteroidota bacterium]